MSSAMAPISIALESLETLGSPGVALLSLVILFILAVTLLALCTSCRGQSFNLEQKAAEDRNSSTLIRVVQLENATVAVDSPIADGITKDECDLGPLPEVVTVETAEGQEIKPWRTHALDYNPERTINGDRNSFTTHRLYSSPVETTHPAMEPSLPMAQTENILSTDTNFPKLEYDSQDEFSEDQATETDIGNISTLQTVSTATQHTYETVGEKTIPEFSMGAEQTVTPLNPYAMYETVGVNDFQWNDPNLPPPPSSEELDESLRDSNATYAKVNKNVKSSSSPVEIPHKEDPEPPLPDMLI